MYRIFVKPFAKYGCEIRKWDDGAKKKAEAAKLRRL
jgi:predicted HD phosphohydrolase